LHCHSRNFATVFMQIRYRISSHETHGLEKATDRRMLRHQEKKKTKKWKQQLLTASIYKDRLAAKYHCYLKDCIFILIYICCFRNLNSLSAVTNPRVNLDFKYKITPKFLLKKIETALRNFVSFFQDLKSLCFSLTAGSEMKV
jgi:uncharacterized membrane protein